MTQRRHIDLNDYPLRRDPDGHPLCRWCGTRVPKGRRSWCSQKCVDEALIRSSAAHVRRLLRQRDRGICAVCGIDCYAVKRWMEAMLCAQRELGLHTYRNCGCDACRQAAEIRYLWRRSYWEAAHIVAVVEGGGACGLDNYQTQCRRCHHADTQALRRRRTRVDVDSGVPASRRRGGRP